MTLSVTKDYLRPTPFHKNALNVNETDLGRIKYGQKAVVTTDTYPDKKYNGKV
ncbi:MAG: hypothetical protein LWW94_02335 [Candidatus Desulfofervidaceae bacterium]|nr:hypothetical protein [Candidatus Desulfofervidaceae bacterium]